MRLLPPAPGARGGVGQGRGPDQAPSFLGKSEKLGTSLKNRDQTLKRSSKILGTQNRARGCLAGRFVASRFLPEPFSHQELSQSSPSAHPALLGGGRGALVSPAGLGARAPRSRAPPRDPSRVLHLPLPFPFPFSFPFSSSAPSWQHPTVCGGSKLCVCCLRWDRESRLVKFSFF